MIYLKQRLSQLKLKLHCTRSHPGAIKQSKSTELKSNLTSKLELLEATVLIYCLNVSPLCVWVLTHLIGIKKKQQQFLERFRKHRKAAIKLTGRRECNPEDMHMDEAYIYKYLQMESKCIASNQTELNCIESYWISLNQIDSINKKRIKEQI